MPINVHSVRVDPPRPSVPRGELPPGPSELPIVGQAFRIRNDLIGLLREAATYGDVSTVETVKVSGSSGSPEQGSLTLAAGGCRAASHFSPWGCYTA